MQRAGDPTILRECVEWSGNAGVLKEGVERNRVVLWDMIQDMVQAVARGIDFVEEGAPAIDEYMTMEGFHVRIHVDEDTGFVVGGNVGDAELFDRSGGTAVRGWTRWAPTTTAAIRTEACRQRMGREVSERQTAGRSCCGSRGAAGAGHPMAGRAATNGRLSL